MAAPRQPSAAAPAARSLTGSGDEQAVLAVEAAHHARQQRVLVLQRSSTGGQIKTKSALGVADTVGRGGRVGELTANILLFRLYLDSVCLVDVDVLPLLLCEE